MPISSYAGPLVVSLVAASCLAGCASQGRAVTIPLGEWRGHGVFVADGWEPEKPISLSREYPTRLTIREAEFGGKSGLEIEIVSERGKIEEDEKTDRTYFRLALVEAKRVSNDVVLYRHGELGLDPDPDQHPTIKDSDQPFGATCMRRDGTTTLIISYMDDFADVLRFRGSSVEKTGQYFYGKGSLIHWTERLKRVAGSR